MLQSDRNLLPIQRCKSSTAHSRGVCRRPPHRAQLIDFKNANFQTEIARLDRSAKYFVYRRSGKRSVQASAIMARLGFTNVSDLDGGITAREAAGASITK